MELIVPESIESCEYLLQNSKTNSFNAIISSKEMP